MTELERARAYLQKQQGRLRCTRAMRPRLPPKIVDPAMARIEADFLAALSWVWDAQGREEDQQMQPFLDYHSNLVAKVFEPHLQALLKSGTIARATAPHGLGGKPSTAKPFYGRR